MLPPSVVSPLHHCFSFFFFAHHRGSLCLFASLFHLAVSPRHSRILLSHSTTALLWQHNAPAMLLLHVLEKHFRAALPLFGFLTLPLKSAQSPPPGHWLRWVTLIQDCLWLLSDALLCLPVYCRTDSEVCRETKPQLGGGGWHWHCITQVNPTEASSSWSPKRLYWKDSNVFQ